MVDPVQYSLWIMVCELYKNMSVVSFKKQQKVLHEKDPDNTSDEKNPCREVEIMQCFSPEGPQLYFSAEKESLLSCNVDHQYPSWISGRVAFIQLC